MNLELILDAQATLGEGPCWDETLNGLWWVDIVEKQLHWFDPATSLNTTIQLEQQIGTVTPRNAESVIVALQDGIYELDLRTRRLQCRAKLENERTDNRFNDGKCDPAGRLWVGTLNMGGVKEAGSLYRLNTDGLMEIVKSGVSVSNGLGWSPDCTKMYWIDSPTKEVTEFDYDPTAGIIDRPRSVVRFREGHGVPDGMTTDEEGMLWIAHWDGGQVSRWNPRTGEMLESISVPAPRVTSCVFGGTDRQDLYITTARIRLDEQALRQYPYSGGLFRLRTSVKGMRTNAFKG
ncbi:SMP-30/gluconolactonase/LRE family protein [Cohnella cholangitidis]|uniref:SMP-30/gluconolactonase/LRE family protein n=1 Tax=Cohnella cholangitidis TaxID=2598458 RepID=A0A7G5BWG6_9BACL|nr:SMP-30/gluconolactonase/LRE family protein [Cohnella cholangitidis]QMV41300.1 SMP-30/gluconolactonase/LRE family protein [Cohnella cholangitidis]